MRLVELGPGKGTLMADVLRAAEAWPGFAAALDVHLVETSRRLRLAQSRALPAAGVTWHETLAEVPGAAEQHGRSSSSSSSGGAAAAAAVPTLLVAHEMLDCLPVHAFEYTEAGWRERLVGLAARPPAYDDAPPVFQYTLADLETAASKALLRGGSGGAAVGDRLEVCPAAMALGCDIAERLRATTGAALVVDYGAAAAPAESVRGFFRHTRVDALDSPGEVDLTADVDFGALARAAAAAVPEVAVQECRPQGHWLQAMGIAERVTSLIEHEDTTEAAAERLVGAYERLVDPKQMGETYQVLAMSAGLEGGGTAGFEAAVPAE